MTRLDRGIQGFIGASSELLFNVLPAVLYLAISVTVMWRLEWKLALLVLAFAPLPVLVAAMASPEQMRQQIGVVLQDPLLFNETVAANIAYGRPGASCVEVEAAARAANADGFIRRLPEGYASLVGERGGLLSIGERQRITIARALLKDQALLILDEATSALDAESEALVQSALERLMKGRTTFVIAHRLATVVHAHRIVVLREGRIAEAGTHRELLSLGGYYASLVHQQTRGLIRNTGEPGIG